MDNRQIDIAIAEKVMGWKGIKRGENPGFDYVGKKPLSDGQNSRDNYLIPPYSTDIAAAWQVVEKMRLLGWRFEIFDTVRHSWWARFGRGEFNHYENEWDEEHIADENSCTLAICLAALKAVGVEGKND